MQGGASFQALVRSLLQDLHSVPPPWLVWFQGHWWSLDNHRLWALRVYAEAHPDWDAAAYFRVCPEAQADGEEFRNKRTTRCDGTGITLRTPDCSSWCALGEIWEPDPGRGLCYFAYIPQGCKVSCSCHSDCVAELGTQALEAQAQTLRSVPHTMSMHAGVSCVYTRDTVWGYSNAGKCRLPEGCMLHVTQKEGQYFTLNN